MNKRFGFFLLALSIPYISYAGLYVGALAGYGVMDLTPDINFTIPQLTPVNVDVNIDFSGKDFMGAPLIGYDGKWGRFRLGTEFQAFWTAITMEAIDTDPTNTEIISLEHEYVWLLRPGYQLFNTTPLVLYANLGATWAKITATPGVTGIQAVDFDDNVWGYKVGLGLAYDITPHFIIRGDYIFSQYQTLSNTASQDFGGNGTGPFVPVSVEFSTTQSQYLIGLAYNW